MLKYLKQNRKKIFSWTLIISLLFSPVGQLSVSAEEPESVATIEEGENIVPDEMILVYDDAGASKKESQKIQAEAEETLNDSQIEVDEVLAESTEDQGTVVIAKVPENLDVDEAVEEVSADDNIVFAQPNYEYQIMEGEAEETLETLSADQKEYYLKATHTLEAWEDEDARVEKDVTVAIFDTGCRLDHEDLNANINTDLAYDVVAEKLLKDRQAEFPRCDATGHGTHVAGLVAAQADNTVGIEGTSYNAEILPIKICADNGNNLTTGTLYKAFLYCIEHFKEINNLKVINLSVGYYSNETDELIENVIDYMKDEYDVLCVCAGGNGNPDKTPRTDRSIPSDLDATLSVTSLDINGKDSVWSDYNEYKDISAPGENINSTMYNGTNSYGIKHGTSMATPIVSGICALIWAKYPELTVDEMVTVIKSSADEIEGQDADRKTQSGSAGAINAVQALALADEMEGDSSGKTSIESTEITLPSQEYEYTGSKIKPEPMVSYNGRVLTKNVDYVVSYTKNKDAGTATVRIAGIGAYCGSKTINFTICPVKLAVSGEYQIVLSGKSQYDYTGKAICPTYVVKRRAINQSKADVELVKDRDYTITYSNNVGAGKATVTITGKGNYAAKNANGQTNSVSGTFSIIKDLTYCSGNITSTITYTGKDLTPGVTVKDGNKTLVRNQDYVLSVSNNRNVGNAQVKVTGIGYYKGSLSGNTKIVPKGTSISKLYSRSKGFQVKWKKQTTQTTGYQIQYSLYSDFRNAKIKTVSKNKTVSLKISKLKKKKYYYVRVRTYKKIGSQYFYSGWSSAKRVKTK